MPTTVIQKSLSGLEGAIAQTESETGVQEARWQKSPTLQLCEGLRNADAIGPSVFQGNPGLRGLVAPNKWPQGRETCRAVLLPWVSCHRGAGLINEMSPNQGCFLAGSVWQKELVGSGLVPGTWC